MGSISLAIKDEMEDFQPFVDHLAERLEGVGIRRGRVVVVETLDAMAAAIGRGEVDVYIDSPFPVAVMKRRVGLRPLLRRWKKGVAEYRTLFFVRSDSPHRAIRDLGGEIVAFDDPFSTSGYLIPKAMLAAAGLAPTEHPHPSAAVPRGTVGYVFSKDDENTLAWVLKGRAAAGAIDDVGFEDLLGERMEDFRIIGRSVAVPRHVLGVRRDYPAPRLAALEDALLHMHEDAKGRRILADFQKTARFDRLPDGSEGGMAGIEALMAEIEGELL